MQGREKEMAEKRGREKERVEEEKGVIRNVHREGLGR